MNVPHIVQVEQRCKELYRRLAEDPRDDQLSHTYTRDVQINCFTRISGQYCALAQLDNYTRAVQGRKLPALQMRMHGSRVGSNPKKVLAPDPQHRTRRQRPIRETVKLD